MSKHHTKNNFHPGYKFIMVFLASMVAGTTLFAQSRISYNNRQLFLSGSNVAWINFGRDIGPDVTNFAGFQSMFDSLRANHGNAMRFWLHTTGQSSPSFGTDKKVSGPGTDAISDLKTILDLAWERKVGLVLCLWSFDMLRTSNGTTITDRSMLMLTDTSALSAYINNALLPMVTALKGHPGIISWEVFNEAEGMSDDYGWAFTEHVPMVNIQRFVNRVAGAIHRTDPGAKVTTGAWAFKVLTDIAPLAKSMSAQSLLHSMSDEEKVRMEKEFSLRYHAAASAEEIISRFAVTTDQNYYRDDRLIASGSDPLGTLDFYTVHYYTWAGTALSPFHHPWSYWQLDKPVAVAEFFMEDMFGVLYKYLYRNLYENGYAGALSWQWYTPEPTQPNTKEKTKEVMNSLFRLYPDDLDVTQTSGKAYVFSASKTIIDIGDTTTLTWIASRGSSTFLNGNPVPNRGSMNVAPATGTNYLLTTSGEVSDTARVTIDVYPTGTIIFYRINPLTIAPGDSAMIYWRTARGSVTTLNGNSVKEFDSLTVHPNSTTYYTLRTTGTVKGSVQITVSVVPPEEINRALNKPITVTPSDSASAPTSMVDGSFSTQWNSASIAPTKIVIDLQQDCQIQKILLSWGTNYATQYRIVTSRDGVNWNLERLVLTGPGGQYTHDSLNILCRFFWLQLDRCAFTTAANYNIQEIQLFGRALPTGIRSISERNAASAFALRENYPNPFNPSTTMEFTVPADGETTLKIFNILGKEVANLFQGWAQAGMVHRVQFHGDFLVSGFYLARLIQGNNQATRKLLLLR
ncbi:MAG: T9SS C-terminal target domain-containing protein [Ignavibacteriae bacterium]|nr:MAG: T9SS C-terminal target domain-containing protein [Ignavibacteriota bacterium]